ncbi:MAG TPA: hypothetical protein VNU68_17220 [Verrucomicrobiae bacterium]|nr:hypothetical protein [Verrucomicrobiae bacterium]
MKPCLGLVIFSVSLLGSLAGPEGFPAASNVGNAFSSPGTDHEWQTWRRSLYDFAPRLFHE